MSSYTHAGGVVFRDREDRREILLVTARRDPGQWVLPKGHVEPDETLEAAALREVREESGVEARIVGRCGSDAYLAAGEAVRVAYFAMRFVRAHGAGEGRDLGWFALAEALERVRFDGARAVIERAWTAVQ